MQTTIDPRTGPQAARLALKLVKWNYGELVEQVAQALIKHGRQNRAELQQSAAGIGDDNLDAALIVLIQQNLVNVYKVGAAADPPPGKQARRFRRSEDEYLYEASMERMLQMIRMPRFLDHVRKEFAGQPHGATCVVVVQTLLYHGRLPMAQLPAAVRSLAAATAPADVASPVKVHAAVQALVRRRYLERAPPCTLPPPPTAVHPNARKKKAQPQAGSEEEAAAQSEGEKARRRAEFQAVRFKLGEDLLAELLEAAEAAAPADELEEEEAAAAAAGAKRKRGGGGAADGKKRGRQEEEGGAPAGAHIKEEEGGAQAAAGVSLEQAVEERRGPGKRSAVRSADAGSSSRAGVEPVPWRLNYEAFNCRFRDAQIVQLVKEQHGARESQAVEALLDAASATETEGPRADHSVATGVDNVRSASQRLHRGDEALAYGEIETMLERVLDDGSRLLDKTERGLYYVNLACCMDVVRLRQAITALRHRFGQPAARVWYLLLLEGQLEQKAVGDMAMVSKVEAREALYNMLRAGFLVLQDVPKGHDHAPSRTFYTWRATAPAASARLGSDLYRAAGNLLARHAAELEARQVLLEKIELVSAARLAAERLDRAEVARLQGVTRALEASLLRLDEQIAVFNDL